MTTEQEVAIAPPLTAQDSSESSQSSDEECGYKIFLLLHEAFAFVPEIECNKIAQNGRIKVKITNFEELLKNGKFDGPHNPCFQLIFRDVSTITTSSKLQWTARNINIYTISNDGEFTLIFPVYLHDYKVQFTLRAINVKTTEWLKFADPIVVHIPSMLIDTAFNVGDKVLFRCIGDSFGHRGEIEEVLEDNTYKIAYRQNGDNCAHEIADRTRMFRPGTPQLSDICLFDPSETIKQMLIKRNDEKSIAVFESLMDVYRGQCFMYGIERYRLHEALGFYESMTVYLTKNICDFLFEPMPQYEYKVKCLVDPHNDGKLIMSNLREMAMAQYCNLKVSSNCAEQAGDSYICDWCYCAMNRFDFVFNCSADCCSERHDICLQCVYTVIKLGTELSSWLYEILHHELDNDCIDVIVDYVVGLPICVD